MAQDSPNQHILLLTVCPLNELHPAWKGLALRKPEAIKKHFPQNQRHHLEKP